MSVDEAIRETVLEVVGSMLAEAIRNLPKAEDRLLTTEEACEFAKVCRKTLESENIPFSKFGNQRRYLVSDLVMCRRVDFGRMVEVKMREMAVKRIS